VNVSLLFLTVQVNVGNPQTGFYNNVGFSFTMPGTSNPIATVWMANTGDTSIGVVEQVIIPTIQNSFCVTFKAPTEYMTFDCYVYVNGYQKYE